MVVAAVAVIGKQNNPLFIRTFERSAAPGEGADAATQLHYVVHAALDVIEERGPCTAFASPISAGVESDVILTPDGS
jgi:hypothetical protein